MRRAGEGVRPGRPPGGAVRLGDPAHPVVAAARRPPERVRGGGRQGQHAQDHHPGRAPRAGARGEEEEAAGCAGRRKCPGLPPGRRRDQPGAAAGDREEGPGQVEGNIAEYLQSVLSIKFSLYVLLLCHPVEECRCASLVLHLTAGFCRYVRKLSQLHTKLDY